MSPQPLVNAIFEAEAPPGGARALGWSRRGPVASPARGGVLGVGRGGGGRGGGEKGLATPGPRAGAGDSSSVGALPLGGGGGGGWGPAARRDTVAHRAPATNQRG